MLELREKFQQSLCNVWSARDYNIVSGRPNVAYYDDTHKMNLIGRLDAQGQSSVPGVCIYGYAPLSYLGNIIMRMEAYGRFPKMCLRTAVFPFYSGISTW